MKTQQISLENNDGREISVGVTVEIDGDAMVVSLAGHDIEISREQIESMGLDSAIERPSVTCQRTGRAAWTVRSAAGYTVTKGVSKAHAIAYAASSIADDVMLDSYYPA